MKRLASGSITLAAFAIALAASNSTAALLGPDYPAPGGNSWSGAGDATAAGGANWSYTITAPGQFEELYWGSWNTPDAVASGLDDALHDMTLSSLSGNQAIWTGTTFYSHSGVNPPAGNYNTRFIVTLGGAASGDT